MPEIYLELHRAIARVEAFAQASIAGDRFFGRTQKQMIDDLIVICRTVAAHGLHLEAVEARVEGIEARIAGIDAGIDRRLGRLDRRVDRALGAEPADAADRSIDRGSIDKPAPAA